jgi:hypothetical protein
MCYHCCCKQICNHDQKMERLDNYIWSLHEITRSMCLLVQHRWWIWVCKASPPCGRLQHLWLLA